MSESDEPAAPQTCCLIRRKIVVGILKVLSEEECGVGDSELADVMLFDVTSSEGRPVLAFRFCPWCGARRDPEGEARVTDITIVGPDAPEPPDEPKPPEEG